MARFAARFHDFGLAPETLALMRRMVAAGEVDALVPERVWQEIARGLMEARPSRMFEVLRECGALSRLLPEVDALGGVPQRADFHPEVDTFVHVMMVIDMAAQLGSPLPTRFAALTHDLGKAQTPVGLLPRHPGHEQHSVALILPLCQRLKVPAECRELARLVARYHGDIHRCDELRPATTLDLLEACDALRRPQRFGQVLLACEADYRGRLGWTERAYPQAATLLRALTAVRTIDAGGIACAVSATAETSAAASHRIAAALRAARIEALTRAKNPG